MATSPRKPQTGLKTRYVFLDTEVYRRYGHNLRDKVLQRLLQLTKDHVCTLHVTDVTLAEIERQLADLAAEVARAVNKGNRLLRNWRTVRSNHSTQAGLQNDIDAVALSKEAIRNFNYAIKIDWEPKLHEALKIPASEIFDLYFRRVPPFDGHDSKEFPDAFVVAVLDYWCQKEHQKMYVITKDKAMLRAVQHAQTLIPLPTLEDYLALLVDDPEVISTVERILASSAWDTVEEQVREQLWHLGTAYSGDFQDGEVIHHEAGEGEIKLADYDVISASDDEIEVVAKIEVPIAFDVQYLDTSSAAWDSEDKEFIGGEREIITLQLDTPLSVLILIDPEENGVTSADLLTRDVYVQEPYDDFK